MAVPLGPFSFERVVEAVNAVNRRLANATRALEKAEITYALTDDNAVAAWVTNVEPTAVRNTPDVTIIIDRRDESHATAVLKSSGFTEAAGPAKHLLIEKPDDRRGVQLFFANERILSTSVAAHPDLSESTRVGEYRVVAIQALDRTKLSTFRDVDRVNLRDLIDVGLLDATWPARYPPELAARLQLLLDTPGG